MEISDSDDRHIAGIREDIPTNSIALAKQDYKFTASPTHCSTVSRISRSLPSKKWSAPSIKHQPFRVRKRIHELFQLGRRSELVAIPADKSFGLAQSLRKLKS